MNKALRLLGEGSPRSDDDVRRLLAAETSPLVEGRHATFLFRGAADEVYLRHWVFGLPAQQPFHQVAPDLWVHTMEVPRRSRIEYKIEVVRGPHHELLLDPLNPQRAHDPYGANSVLMGEGYEVPEWAVPDPEARPGAIDALPLFSRVFGDERLVRVYLPARFRRRARYPLLVVHDGGDYLRFSGLKTVLDNLIHRLEIPPLVVALLDSPVRLREFGADDRHARFLVEEMVPMLERGFPLVGNPSARALMGASFGAVAVLHAAWKHPGFFGNLLLQSGSFAFSDIGPHQRGPLFDGVVDFVNDFRRKPGRPADRIFVTCGIYESLIYENRSLLPVLQSTGAEVRFVEARDGHNWENWRDRLREGLSWLLPGPLWMVYE